MRYAKFLWSEQRQKFNRKLHTYEKRRFNGKDFKSYDYLRNEIEKYVKWYTEDWIKTKLNGMSPVIYRLHSA